MNVFLCFDIDETELEVINNFLCQHNLTENINEFTCKFIENMCEDEFLFMSIEALNITATLQKVNLFIAEIRKTDGIFLLDIETVNSWHKISLGHDKSKCSGQHRRPGMDRVGAFGYMFPDSTMVPTGYQQFIDIFCEMALGFVYAKDKVVYECSDFIEITNSYRQLY